MGLEISRYASVVLLTVVQTTNGTAPSFYTMPIDIRLTIAGRDTTVRIFNNAQQQTFTIFCPVKPTLVLLDPDGWILKFSSSGIDRPPSTYVLDQNYPNPFNSFTTISYQLPNREQVSLKVYDMVGRLVATLVDSKQFAGTYEVQWNPDNLASGTYVYILNSGSVQIQNKMVFLK